MYKMKKKKPLQKENKSCLHAVLSVYPAIVIKFHSQLSLLYSVVKHVCILLTFSVQDSLGWLTALKPNYKYALCYEVLSMEVMTFKG